MPEHAHPVVICPIDYPQQIDQFSRSERSLVRYFMARIRSRYPDESPGTVGQHIRCLFMLVDAALDELVDAFEAGFGEDAAYIARCRGDAAEPLLRSAWIDGAAWATQQKHLSGSGLGEGSRFLLN